MDYNLIKKLFLELALKNKKYFKNYYHSEYFGFAVFF